MEVFVEDKILRQKYLLNSDLQREISTGFVKKKKVLIFEELGLYTQLSLHLNDGFNLYRQSGIKELFPTIEENNFDALILGFSTISEWKMSFISRIKNDSSLSVIPLLLVIPDDISIADQKSLYRAGVNEIISFPDGLHLLSCRIENYIKYRNNCEELSLKKDSLNHISQNKESESFIEKANRVIIENISDPFFSTEKFSNILCISRATLFRQIKIATGISPTALINNTKLDYAAKLLSVTNRPINELAYELGFSGPSYFSKIFRLKFNMSPREYRVSIKNKRNMKKFELSVFTTRKLIKGY